MTADDISSGSITVVPENQRTLLGEEEEQIDAEDMQALRPYDNNKHSSGHGAEKSPLKRKEVGLFDIHQ